MLRAASDAVGAVQHRGPIQQQQRIEAQNWFADNSTSILIQQLPVFFCESREYAQRVTESLLCKYAREVEKQHKAIS